MAEELAFSGDLKTRAAAFEAVHRVNLGLVSNRDTSLTLNTILTEITALVPNVSAGQVFLYETGRLNLGAALQAGGAEGQPSPTPRLDGLSYSVARLGKLISIADLSADPLFTDAALEGSGLGLPLKIGQRVVGVLTLFRSPVRPFSSEETALVAVFANQAALAIENNRLQLLLEQQTRLDPLTGLHNRRSFEERVEVEIARNQPPEDQPAISGQAPHPFSILIMDLDGFKKMNETYGRLAGDYILKEIANSINQALRKTDFLARYGGDEIALVLSDSNRETTQMVASRVQDFVSRTRFNLPNIPQHSLSISIGVAHFPENGAIPQELLAAAEGATALAKRDSENRIRFAGPAQPSGDVRDENS
ncbi:MAG TPA: sensor domain-containing diguanylate cyclase [Anaerolineaceae bacterium]|nr:sensor domain-containing diguanylate cyclase [Anaerolineaceae bacterium]